MAKQAGTSAVLISTDDGSVVDFIHVWIAPVTHIALARRGGERIAGSLGLAVGEDVTLVPSLFSGAQKLAGDPDATRPGEPRNLRGDANHHREGESP